MDVLPTFFELAGVPLPSDLVLDGASLVPSWLMGEESESRPAFFYRGDLLYAVRQGAYKMHLWTWTTPPEELMKAPKIDFIWLCLHFVIRASTTAPTSAWIT